MTINGNDDFGLLEHSLILKKRCIDIKLFHCYYDQVKNRKASCKKNDCLCNDSTDSRAMNTNNNSTCMNSVG